MIRWLFNRWHLKLVSLVLAYAVWLAIVGETRIVQDFNVPLDIALQDEAILTGPRATRVTVRLRGSPAQVRRLDPLRLEVKVDLRDAAPGERNVQLEPENVLAVPVGVEVEQIEPRRLTLTIARRVTRVLPVVAYLVGDPPPGYALYDAFVVPDTLTVEGPESEVAAMTRLRTDPIPLENERETLRVDVAAVPDSSEVRIVDPRPLMVRVEIDHSPVDRDVEGVPVVLAGQVYEVRVTPETLTARLSGPPNALERLAVEQLRMIVDVADLAPRAEPYSVTPRLDYIEVPARDLSLISERTSGRRSVSVRVLERRISE